MEKKTPIITVKNDKKSIRTTEPPEAKDASRLPPQ